MSEDLNRLEDLLVFEAVFGQVEARHLFSDVDWDVCLRLKVTWTSSALADPSSTPFPAVYQHFPHGGLMENRPLIPSQSVVP